MKVKAASLVLLLFALLVSCTSEQSFPATKDGILAAVQSRLALTKKCWKKTKERFPAGAKQTLIVNFTRGSTTAKFRFNEEDDNAHILGQCILKSLAEVRFSEPDSTMTLALPVNFGEREARSKPEKPTSQAVSDMTK